MKRGSIVLLCILCTLGITSTVFASAGGVVPASYSLNFEPNLKKDFTFSYMFDDGVESEVQINSGYLGKYFKVKQADHAFGRYVVVVEMNLPDHLEIPGEHKVGILAQEKNSKGEGVRVVSSVGGWIKIRVPYPGKYADISMSTEFANTGEDVPFKLTVYSRGNETIVVYPTLVLSNINGVVAKKVLDVKTIPPQGSYTYEGFFSTLNFKPGDYNLTTTVEYGGASPAKAISLIRLGELRVDIVNHSKSLLAEKVERFNVDIESFWNDPINDVYADFSVVGYPGRTFTTPTIILNPWGKSRLIAFIDTKDIKEEKMMIETTVHYAGNMSTTKVLEVNLERGTNWVLIGIVAAVIVVLLIIISLIIIIIKLLKSKKSNNSKSKKNEK